MIFRVHQHICPVVLIFMFLGFSQSLSVILIPVPTSFHKIRLQHSSEFVSSFYFILWTLFLLLHSKIICISYPCCVSLLPSRFCFPTTIFLPSLRTLIFSFLFSFQHHLYHSPSITHYFLSVHPSPVFRFLSIPRGKILAARL